ncbi:MAG: hypothetical protein Q7S66_01835 [bacterium]|nr:hypothetical protein [bacterium]
MVYKVSNISPDFPAMTHGGSQMRKADDERFKLEAGAIVQIPAGEIVVQLSRHATQFPDTPALIRIIVRRNGFARFSTPPGELEHSFAGNGRRGHALFVPAGLKAGDWIRIDGAEKKKFAARARRATEAEVAAHLRQIAAPPPHGHQPGAILADRGGIMLPERHPDARGDDPSATTA